MTILIFAEAEFSHAEEVDGEDEARAFLDGLEAGASLYGAGSCAGYLYPEDEKLMREHESAREIARAIREVTRNPRALKWRVI